MRRLLPLLSLTILLVACATTPSAVPPPPPPPPPPAPVPEAPSVPPPDCSPSSKCAPMGECPSGPTNSARVEISVDEDGNASPSCVWIKRGNTEVAWIGTSDVVSLKVGFKSSPENGPLADPDCKGTSTCTLDKAKQAMAKGDYHYWICVERKNGKKVYCDPKLIIQP